MAAMAAPSNTEAPGASDHFESLTVHTPPSEQMTARRVGWDEYFMNIARQVATRSTCSRKHVGALIVKNRMILATGYNGSLRGLAHCDEVGHLMENGHCVRTVHAEANAIVQAARSGTSLEGAAIYVTASPCFNCFKLIANAGINKIAYGEFYRDEKIYTFATEMSIELVEVKVENPLLP
jgi:dCMP deaminase